MRLADALLIGETPKMKAAFK